MAALSFPLDARLGNQSTEQRMLAPRVGGQLRRPGHGHLQSEFAQPTARVRSAQDAGRIPVQLLDAIWGTTYEGYEHNVNTHINRLRGKIETDPANPRYVLTVRGVGYRFTDQR